MIRTERLLLPLPWPRIRRVAWVAGIAWLSASCAPTAVTPAADRCGDAGGTVPDACAPLHRGSEVAYTARISGDLEDSVRSLLERSSQLNALADAPPRSPAGLIHRAETDRDRLGHVMRAEGYFDATIADTIDFSRTPADVNITVVPGPPFLIAALLIQLDWGEQAATAAPDLARVDRYVGKRASGRTIAEAEKEALRTFADHARPLAAVIDQSIVVDHASARVRVTFTIDPGPLVRFGEALFNGLDRIDGETVQALVPWLPGQPFDQRKVDRLRQRLQDTDLFTLVQVRLPTKAVAFGEMPVTVDVVERPPRTVGVGASYSTSEGPGGEVLWERRGLSGRNDTVRAIARANRFTQRGIAEFERGNFGRPDQALLFDGEVIHTNSKAFNQLTGKTFAGIRRILSPEWRVSLGLSAEASRLKDANDSGTSVLAGVPIALTRDDTDSWLEPTEGTRLLVRSTPYSGWFERQIAFVNNEIGTSAYTALDDGGRAVLAGHVRFGSLFGASRDDSPANQRFYAGGDGSIRGYQYQRVGPLDADNQPLGGRSLFLISGEARLRAGRNFGLGPFVDGGSVFDQVYPSFSETVRWAAGMGFWYVTAIGPVRLDVAVPINGRGNTDDPFELYIGLGHAF